MDRREQAACFCVDVINDCQETMLQRNFANVEYAFKKRRTRREAFFADLGRLVP